MKLNISPHDISLPLSLVSSYPQSSLMPDHGETLWNCFPQKQLLFIFPLWTVSFWFSLLHFSLSLVFSFVLRSAGFRLLLCVNLLCMYTHFPWLPVHWCTSRHKGLVWASFRCCQVVFLDFDVLLRLHCYEEQIMTELALDLNRCCKWRCFSRSNHVSNRCSSHHQGFR